jgi:hypothetical protein
MKLTRNRSFEPRGGAVTCRRTRGRGDSMGNRRAGNQGSTGRMMGSRSLCTSLVKIRPGGASRDGLSGPSIPV